MPEGFEAPRGLRDLLSYISSGDEKYPFVDAFSPPPTATRDYANRELARIVAFPEVAL